ncbi:MAG: lamin tail domain-containing protein [Flavisolibacter sp.]
MRTKRIHIQTLLTLIAFFVIKTSCSQGRVVINEYLPWTSNGCGATSEFVELMNFGPGPINIGCYILTDGDYSVTIPPNTILQPGEFYVIAGQDVLNTPCANIDSTVHANLNWNSCGCTSAPIPTTGDGFFTDGGAANEQVVLLDANLKVVDAVVRAFPAEPSSLITTSNVGGCGSKTFNLDQMSINYETLGMSTGRGNSFARKLDGDCGWVKDPQQSGHATNNTPGETSSVTYSLSIVKSMDCDTTHGTIDIFVNVGDYTGPMFPMNYTVAFDANNDGKFDFSDTYTYGTDSTPPSIEITGLPLGRYRVTVGSVNGCFLTTFNITILECRTVLPVQLAYFKLLEQKPNSETFEWQINQMELIRSVQLEKSIDGRNFISATKMDSLHLSGTRIFEQTVPGNNQFNFYRLRLTDINGRVNFSNVINTTQQQLKASRVWPNPARDEINFQFSTVSASEAQYQLRSIAGAVLRTGVFSSQAGTNTLKLPLNGLPAGMYQLSVISWGVPISFRFVKH